MTSNQPEYESITCRRCKKTSYSQGDISHLFCVSEGCGWHQDMARESGHTTYYLNKKGQSPKSPADYTSDPHYNPQDHLEQYKMITANKVL